MQSTFSHQCSMKPTETHLRTLRHIESIVLLTWSIVILCVVRLVTGTHGFGQCPGCIPTRDGAFGIGWAHLGWVSMFGLGWAMRCLRSRRRTGAIGWRWSAKLICPWSSGSPCKYIYTVNSALRHHIAQRCKFWGIVDDCECTIRL